MKQDPKQEQSQRAVFNVELTHSTTQANLVPPSETARTTIAELEAVGNQEAIDDITRAAEEVGGIIRVTRTRGGEDEGIIDIFTAAQVKAMQSRIHAYLGTDLDTHLRAPERPSGYPFYIGQLATYFMSYDSVVTSSFGSFERTHTDPTAHATGPREHNSRRYANEVNQNLLRQFEAHYQTDVDIRLVGPTKTVPGGSIVWERGVAECQFLVMDYIRDQLSASYAGEPETEQQPMTMADIEQNMRQLLVNRTRIIAEASSMNPLIAPQLGDALDVVAGFTVDVIHRGRFGGAKRFMKEPHNARRAIQYVEALLQIAARYDEAREGEEEIPVLDI